VLFADPQQAINRSVYISDSKYGVTRTTNKTKKKNRNKQANKIIPCLLRIPSFDM
jgi:hypothetical protein